MEKKSLFLIHGRNFKPPKNNLEQNWLDAIEHGLERDYGVTSPELQKFNNNINKQFIYYGSISNKFLIKRGKKYNSGKDIQDREDCLEILKKFNKEEFLNKQGKKNYRRIPGHIRNWLFKTLAFLFADFLAGKFAPIDIRHYWEPETKFGSEVRGQLTNPLLKAFKDGDDIMLVGHSLGTMISYDVLWKFSYYWEYKKLREALNQQNLHGKVSFLVTLGSPLGNLSVQRNLKGAANKGKRRYPTLIKQWINIAAVGDYVCHDNTLADDYRKMEEHKLVESIEDLKIYNLAVRKGKSNPHHGTGYLIHPTFIKVLANWLNS